MSRGNIITVLDPADEFPHEPDPVPNYNESMYLNGFDAQGEVGGWFRIGNRVNEGYAEMTVCLYLPPVDGVRRIGFVYAKPEIDSNDKMEAGGLSIEVVEPFEHLRVRYSGKVCVLSDPTEMAQPRQAFRNNPWEPCTVELDYRGVSPMYGGKPQYEDGTEPDLDAEKSFAKAHYEQHCAVTGTITVGDETITLDGLGLRDKSWGPRYWQAIEWYRWLPMTFSDEFAMMISVVGGRPGGMVLVGDEYHLIRDCRIESEVDENGYQTAMRATVSTDHDRSEVAGAVLSLSPLRNRRRDPEGNELTTRITEAMTRYRCNGQDGIGMSEYLDQIVDGRPVGPDLQ
ncbi:MAG: hypothetical protein ACK5PP_11965 [Acidimicrobiales bacterium]